MSKPSKEQVRDWQEKNRKEHRPPPTPEQTKRELGWDLIKETRKQKSNK